jgi:hypothetical protein
MKRILKIATVTSLACLIPITAIKSQDKKNEQHIKIVVADKSGTKIELDTLIKGSPLADSIKLKNGEVIYLRKHGSVGTIKHIEGDKGTMVVTVTSDNEGDEKTVKEIKVISGDSVKIIHTDVDGDVIIMKKGGKYFEEGCGGRVMSWSSVGGGTKGKSIIYFNEGTEGLKDGEKTFNVEVKTDKSGETIEKTKYVLAKDGMVISIEGNDEAKVKDLVKDIETKLDVKKEGTTTKPVVKEETKKNVKK